LKRVVFSRIAIGLTRQERKQLDPLLQSEPAVSLNKLFAQWAEFVRAVERGYDGSIYEYTNDLCVRDRLQSLIAASSPTLRAKLEKSLAPVDERFTVATEPAARPLRSDSADPPSWWRRIPRRRRGELGDDLETMGAL
jgi:hypothetical protein